MGRTGEKQKQKESRKEEREFHGHLSQVVDPTEILADMPAAVYAIARNLVIAKRIGKPECKANAYVNYTALLSFTGLLWPSRIMERVTRSFLDAPQPELQLAIVNYYFGFHLYATGRLRDAELIMLESQKTLRKKGSWLGGLAIHLAGPAF